jgi:hypothetical protein
MNRLRLAALAAFFALASAAPARADGFFTPFWGFNFGGDQGDGCPSLTNCEVHRSDWGVSLGSMSPVGFEEDIGYSKNFFGDAPESDNAVLTLMSSLLVGGPSGPVRPYGLFGVGLIRPHFTASNLVSFANNSFGWDIGGGVNFYFSRSIGVRGDLRKFQTFSDVDFGAFQNEKLNFWRASLGLALKF